LPVAGWPSPTEGLVYDIDTYWEAKKVTPTAMLTI